jgi:hypothetical protein
MKASALLPPDTQAPKPPILGESSGSSESLIASTETASDGALTVLQPGEGADTEAMKPAGTNPLAIFDQYRADLEKLKATAEKLTVTSVDQTLEIRMAGEARLALKKLRCEVERRRKELVEDAVATQRGVNKVAGQLKDLIEPLEARMQAQEDFVAREEARIGEERRTHREAALAPYTIETSFYNLASMPEESFHALLTGQKAAFEARTAETARLALEARKAEDARVAQAKADAEAREAQRLENERLKKEAEEREAQAKRLKDEAVAREAKIKADAQAERNRIEAENERQRAKERAEAKKRQDEADAKARKEREALEAENRQKEEEYRKTAALEAQERKRIQDQLDEQKRVHQASIDAEIERKRKLAAADDAELLRDFKDRIRNATPPKLHDAALSAKVHDAHHRFQVWIEEHMKALNGPKGENLL